MKLYDIKKEITEKCIIDINQYSSLDEYLLKNKFLKRLVYGYLKKSDHNVKLSYLDQIFKNTTTLEGLYSNQQLEYYRNDQFYKYVFDKYIKSPETWLNGHITIQPYLFDSKFLLKGEYQIHAYHSVQKMFGIANPYYLGQKLNIRSFDQEILDFYNNWFKEKRNFERKFYDKIISKFEIPNHLQVRYYWKFIEIYDTTTSLTLQIELKNYTNSSVNVLMPVDVVRSSFGRRNNLSFKFLMKEKFASDLYSYLINSLNINEINEFLDKLEHFEEMTQSKVYQSVIVHILEDFRDKNDAGSFGDPFLDVYLLQYNSIEKNSLHYSITNKLLRYHRKIKNSDGSIVQLASYNLPKDIDKAAKILLMSGFINICQHGVEMSEKEYQYVAKDEDSNQYIMQFLRTPLYDVGNEMSLYSDYEKQLSYDIKEMQKKGIEINFEDSRGYSKEYEYTKLKSNLNYFDYMLYQKNKEKFLENNDKRLESVQKRLQDFEIKNSYLIEKAEHIAKNLINKT